MLVRPATSLALVLLSASCAEGFDEHEAFEGESYLCGTTTFDDLVAECADEFADDGGCAGVISYRGTLQQQNVIVASRLDEADLLDLIRLDASRDRRGANFRGRSPYFEFELELDYLGGDVNLGATNRLLPIGPPADPDFPLDDMFSEGALRIASGLSSRDQNFASGLVTITFQGPDRTDGSFDATTFGGDSLEGCFVAFDASPSVAVESP